MCRPRFRFLCFLYLLSFTFFLSACHQAPQSKITIGSKFFPEQVVLAELLAQHIEARTGIPVTRKTNLGGTLLVHRALQAGELDLYVEYTGTALTAVLNELPPGDSPPSTIASNSCTPMASTSNLPSPSALKIPSPWS